MVYVAARPVLGVMLNEIYFIGSLTDNRAELLYIDSQVHLPAPEKFSNINSPSGLKIRSVKPPREFRIDYVGYDNTEIHVDWNGIMDPFDVHDPAHTPHAVGTEEEKIANSGCAKAWKGHFDMTGRVTGTVKVRGKEFNVNSLERMDHSWGERGELELPAMDSISAQFDENLAFHLITHVDLDAPNGQDQKLAHGYVLEDGTQYGVMEAGHHQHAAWFNYYFYATQGDRCSRQGLSIVSHGRCRCALEYLCHYLLHRFDAMDIG